LLTKIENKQFVPVNTLNIIDILNKYISEFEPLSKMKKIKVDLIIEDGFSIKMNEQLAGILVSNLLSNCINHNINGGLMQISVKKNGLMICNTGLENTFTDENIFDRFVKGPAKSYGLGLAIVKKNL
jgi:signal transduction histidine kinase